MKLRLVLALFVLASVGTGQRLARALTIPDTMGTLEETQQLFPNPVTGRVYVTASTGTLLFEPESLVKARRFRTAGLMLHCSAAGKLLAFDSAVEVYDALADTWLRTVPVPFPAGAAVLSPASGRVYLTSPDDRRPVLVFDPAAESVVAVVNTGSANAALVWDSTFNRIFVGLYTHLGRLAVIDCASDSIVGYVRTGISTPTALGHSPQSRRVYCSGMLDSASAPVLVAVSTDSLVPVGMTLNLPAFSTLRYDPFADRLYAWELGTLYAIDCATGMVRTAPTGAEVTDVACDPATGRTYVAEPGRLTVLDTALLVVAELPLPGAGTSWPECLAISPLRQELYCALESDLVYLFDIGADTLRGTIDYSLYQFRDLIFNPGADKLYLLDPSNNVVLVLDREFRLTARIPRGVTDTRAIPVLDPVLNRLYVGDNRMVRVIDCNTDALVDSLPVPGLNDPLPLLVPEHNKLYVFPWNAGSSGRRIWVYDVLRNVLLDTIWLGRETPCAAYLPGTNKLYFAQASAPAGVLDVTTDSIIGFLAAGNASTHSRMLANSLNQRLYFANGSTNLFYTIDARNDSILSTQRVSVDLDTIFWNRQTNRLYLAASGAPTVVFDCATDRVIESIPFGPHYCGLMNERNDKLYLGSSGGIAVFDCRNSSLHTLLTETGSPRRGAWNPARNLMAFVRRTNQVMVYEDDLTGIEAERPGRLLPGLSIGPNPARHAVTVCWPAPLSQLVELDLYDVAGRTVLRSSAGLGSSSVRLDPSSLPAGVYLLCLTAADCRTTHKLVVQD